MRRRTTLLLAVVLAGVTSLSPPLRAGPQDEPGAQSWPPTIAVADFAGSDAAMGGFLAETLQTALGQSQELRLAECSEVHRVLGELRLRPAALDQPELIARIGKRLGVDELIVGSYLVHGDRVSINARLLEVASGRMSPGHAASATGPQDDLVRVVHLLASTLHQRLTGKDLPLDGEAPVVSEPHDPAMVPAVNPRIVEPDPAEAPAAPERHRLLPSSVSPKAVVSERELGALVGRISKCLAWQPVETLTIQHPNGPVSRLRVLTALARLVLPNEVAGIFEKLPDEALPPDAAEAARWGQRYLGAAVRHGWWYSDEPFRPKQAATWSFVETLLTRFGWSDEEAASETYSGLIIDARELPIQRAMGPRILDPGGTVLYPDPRCTPPIDIVEDLGMATYVTESDRAPRSGKNPLTVAAIDVTGPASEDLVVSSETARLIREASQRGGFLRHWAVSILVNAKQ